MNSTPGDTSTNIYARVSRDKADVIVDMQTPNSSRMISRRFIRLTFVLILMIGITTVYVTLFQHPPPDQLMEMNKRGAKDFDISVFNDDNADDRTDDDVKDRDKSEDDTNDEDLMEKDDEVASRRGPKRREAKGDKSKLKGSVAWNRFIQDNGHTAIGVVFDRCEKPTEQLGTVIMLPDPEFGGVKSRTFYNFTLYNDLEGGTFHVEVRYNGQDLYDNWWEICEMEEDLEPQNRTFSCPIRKGRQSLIKDKHIPGYLPKGRYQSKAWVNTEQGELLVCGFSDFVL
ncbi:hypothetical protein BaRGS_00003109 [Batillaria attramentaria]|uniref:MD-2-related lipid-recognition domain-containing protein n=1 Tax=Batillaria attramentaria TaxID=370345 RepID=A0ABD0M2C6_9CAEN